MSTLPTKTSNTAKQWRFRFWIVGFTILLVSPFLLYYGYCWGLWEKNSLLLQYYFQCNCPASSEEWRYPKEVDVIISACRNGGVRLSPSGRFIYVREENSELTSTYLLDLQTNDEVPINLPEGDMYFLTDDLIYIFVWFGRGYEGGEHIFDRTTDTMYSIQSFIHLQPNAYSYGKLDPTVLFKALLQVEKVFLIDPPYQPVIALSSDFQTQPEQSFIFEASALSGDHTNLLEQFLRENNITYYHIPANFPHEAISPDGRLLARDDGIYLVEMDQMIVKAPLSFVRGWTYDGRGVIYAASHRCLLRLGLPFGDDTWCEIEVPQPVLLLKVPEEYLVPQEVP